MASEAELKARLILKNYLYKDEIDKIIHEFERQGIVLTSLYSKVGN
jgi:hypothetical protein